jgi:hypothetical protein
MERVGDSWSVGEATVERGGFGRWGRGQWRGGEK